MQAMKINAKVKGINHKLLTEPCAWMKTEPFIVFGEERFVTVLACTQLHTDR